MMVQKCIFVFFVTTLFWSPTSVRAHSGESHSGSCSCASGSSSGSSSDEYQLPPNCPEHHTAGTGTVYDYTVKDVYGENVCLSKYQGRVLIIVNYASKCVFTDTNVNKLSTMAKTYGDKGLTVLVFPSNSFCENVGGNPAGRQFAKEHPEFVVFSEVCVNGNDEDPLYTYLKSEQPGALGVEAIECNFVKFVVDKNGHAVERYGTVNCDFEGLEKSVQTYCGC